MVFSSDDKANTQKLVFNHIPTEAGLDFSPALSGKGQIEHKQGHTILSGDSAQFAGSTAQADLAVNRQATLGLGYAGEFASRSQQRTVSTLGLLKQRPWSSTRALPGPAFAAGLYLVAQMQREARAAPRAFARGVHDQHPPLYIADLLGDGQAQTARQVAVIGLAARVA